MAAGITISPQANAEMFYREAKKIQNKRMVAPMRPDGLYAVNSGAVTIATTDIDDVGDEVRLLKFPDQCYLLPTTLSVTATDMDSNATPLLAFDINTDDGSTEVQYIAATTIGQSSGSKQAAADKAQLVDVSNLYLSLKVTAAAATGVAGTVTAKCLVYLGTPIVLT